MNESPERKDIPGRPNLLDCLKAAYRLHKAGGAVEAVRSGDDLDRDAATKSSLLKLALRSVELHAMTKARDITFEDPTKTPLAVACAALATIRKNEGA
jgi:hypothetical protein